MLKLLSRGENHRKDRLFLVACCRSIWHLLVQPGCREAVELAERHAEGEASWEELDTAREELERVLDRCENDAENLALDALSAATWGWQGLITRPTTCFGRPSPFLLSGHHRGEGLDIEMGGLFAWMAAGMETLDDPTREQAWRDQVALVHCIYGNPFHPRILDPNWLARNGGLVTDLAQAAQATDSSRMATWTPSGWPCWPMRWKRAGLLPSWWPTSDGQSVTFAAALCWTSCWARIDAVRTRRIDNGVSCSSVLLSHFDTPPPFLP
jgi:hypothetical protein